MKHFPSNAHQSLPSTPISNGLNVVLCWHMHQPNYKDALSGIYQLPWTYLHAIKDYVDMAAYLEVSSTARAVVNFSPTLLEQIADYREQVRNFLQEKTPISDPILQALASGIIPQDLTKRLDLANACCRTNEQRGINRYTPYRKLVDMILESKKIPGRFAYYSDQFFQDLLVWYHIAWLAETVRDRDRRIIAIIEKKHGFNEQDRLSLMSVIDELLNGLIERYKILAEQGRVELSMTPYAHPISPLLLSFGSARQAVPNIELPSYSRYNDGLTRAKWHIQKGIEVFEKHFGHRPIGCWPSEGGVCEESLRLIGKAGFRWAATGENVLSNSLSEHEKQSPHKSWLFQPYYAPNTELACFFRDDGLSDLIGFEYANWHADDAVNNLISHLERIQVNMEKPNEKVVAIIMDGENAWETYPRNAWFFLTALYRRLTTHSSLNLTTFSAYLDSNSSHKELARITAGSWVYGTFSTWIGDQGKNRAWDLLCDAKKVYDNAITENILTEEEKKTATQQLALCEASDWWWWLGDYNPSDVVHDFDKLFRNHLCALYTLLKCPIPTNVTDPISRGSKVPALGGVMRRGTER